MLKIEADDKVFIPKPDPAGNNRLEITVSSDAWGRIDALGRYDSNVGPYVLDSSGHPTGQFVPPIMHGPVMLGRVYPLVLTDVRWEYVPQRNEIRKVKGSVEWRIDGFENEPWVTVDVAIRYLMRLGGESSDEAIKNNAKQSIITILRNLKVRWGR